jgi:hypothetical protein
MTSATIKLGINVTTPSQSDWKELFKTEPHVFSNIEIN